MPAWTACDGRRGSLLAADRLARRLSLVPAVVGGVMRAPWTVAIVIVLQVAILGGAIGVAFYERHQRHFECGKPSLVATVVGYSLWKVRDCGPGGSSVY